LPEPEPIVRHKSDSELAFGDELHASISRKESLAVDDLPPPPGFSQIMTPKRKFAKTLRLTSDQLVDICLIINIGYPLADCLLAIEISESAFRAKYDHLLVIGVWSSCCYS
jgi:hypothetical protein